MLNNLNWFGSSAGSTSVSLSRRSQIPANTFREIIKRLQSFGIIAVTVESGKITDNVYGQLVFFLDEITAAFEGHEIYSQFESTIRMYTTNQDVGGTAAGLTTV